MIAAPREAFAADSLTDAKSWQIRNRRRFAEMLGGVRRSVAPLKSKSVGFYSNAEYTREAVVFESCPGLQVFAYLLLPKSPHRPLPAVICLPGHGYGVDGLVGIDAHGKQVARPDYHNDFALQAVRRGYAVLALEVLGFGRRREGDSPPGSSNSSCVELSVTALMMGQSVAAWRVNDTIRALDYLATREEVDPSRIALMGISGGGLIALFTAALDLRVSATMLSGYFSTFKDSVMSIPHCIDNFVPGLAAAYEMTDLAALVAPRPLWCENGTTDPIFPLAAFRRAVRTTRKTYRVFNASRCFGSEEFSGGHYFHGQKAWPFLGKYLQ